MIQKYYFALYKPFGVLSQFRPEGEKPGLGTLYDFPSEVYPVGRLDADSEGLLLLTNDNHFKTRLLNPQKGHPRTYWVQVEGRPTEAQCQMLAQGVEIRIEKKLFRTRPARVAMIEVPELPARVPPIRERLHIPTAWLALTLTEGKNRQVRRMTAKVGLPTLRLVRAAIGQYHLGARTVGEVWALSPDDLRQILQK
ncbi:MAG: pseudouridine synthase [Microscillaceae bacterium]|nr:pseudouridine synthase [Microscillaceae bacterium]